MESNINFNEVGLVNELEDDAGGVNPTVKALIKEVNQKYSESEQRVTKQETDFIFKSIRELV